MILEIIGSFIVIAGSTYLGYMFSSDYSKRPQHLRVLQALLQMLENEICYLSSPLSEAFEKIHRSGNCEVAIFFKMAVKNLRQTGLNASEAWEKAVRGSIRHTSLNSEDEEILVSFGRMLGSSDVEGQIKNINLTVNQLKLQEQKAEESRKKNETMYRSLGVLGGLALVIILF